jgi:hypothetical protein
MRLRALVLLYSYTKAERKGNESMVMIKAHNKCDRKLACRESSVLGTQRPCSQKGRPDAVVGLFASVDCWSTDMAQMSVMVELHTSLR